MEIGSEYNLDLSELSKSSNNINIYLSEFNTILFDSGRSGLRAIIDCGIISEGKVLVPEYMCESVLKCFDISKLVFYRIDDNLSIDLDDLRSKINSDVSSIFIMHYFGMVQPLDILKRIRNIADQYGITIIEDTTHSILSCKNTIGDYMISSIRKWLPVPKAGILYSKKELTDNMISEYKISVDNDKAVGMILKDMFLNNNFDCNEEYRRIFIQNERRLDVQNKIELASELSSFILDCYDVHQIANVRKDNYQYLLKRLMESGYEPVNIIKNDEVPFAYVIRSNDRDGLREYLIDNNIYCAIHWPMDEIWIDKRESHVKNAETFLSLPIDHRYSKEHMEYLANILLSFKRSR